MLGKPASGYIDCSTEAEAYAQDGLCTKTCPICRGNGVTEEKEEGCTVERLCKHCEGDGIVDAGNDSPRTILPEVKEMALPNDRQQSILIRLRAALTEKYGAYAHKYEFKEFKIEAGYAGTIYLISETGYKGDEGTMAAVFGRDRRMIGITPRGGIYLMNAKDLRRKGTSCRTRKEYPRGFHKAVYTVVPN